MQINFFGIIVDFLGMYILPLIPPIVIIGGIMWYIYPGRKEIACERKGLCPHCGYDIRASRERCPECGKVILRPVGATKR
jgi:hypothetical protein